LQAKTQALDVLKRRMERYQEQFAACTIIAPADGLVVYSTSGDRNAQNALQEGSQVRERQALLRLPDTSSMKAVLRIGESQVWRLREGMRAKVNLTNGPPMDATLSAISVLSDNSQRWWNDAKEYPVDLTLDQTPPSLKPGMGVKCEILIDRADNALAVPLSSIYTAGRKAMSSCAAREMMIRCDRSK
jgi:multidrug resistance efflux pump